MELDYPPRLQRLLLTPQREVTVELVVPMDNGEIEVFNAYRVQHNNSRGPYKVRARGPGCVLGAGRAAAVTRQIMWLPQRGADLTKVSLLDAAGRAAVPPPGGH